MSRRDLAILIIKNREIKIKTPKTKYHSPIKVTALKKIVKNGVRICSTKFRVEISNCLIKSIFILYNKKSRILNVKLKNKKLTFSMRAATGRPYHSVFLHKAQYQHY